MRTALKRIFYTSLGHTGLDALIRPLLGGTGTILMFHRVLPDPPATDYGPSVDLSLSPEAFRSIVEYLRRIGRDIVSLDEALRRLRGEGSARKFACLTFDDGYRDNYEVVFPICKEMEVPITVYVTTDFIDKRLSLWWYGLEQITESGDLLRLPEDLGMSDVPTRTSEEKAAAFRHVDIWMCRVAKQERLRMIDHLERTYGMDFTALAEDEAMTWPMVKELSASELVEIGGHTISHPALSQLPEKEARKEIEQGREILQRNIERPVRHFAYPFGGVGEAAEREFAMCGDLGFITATTTRAGNLFPHHHNRPHSLPRVAVAANETLATLKADMSGAPGLLRAIASAISRR